MTDPRYPYTHHGPTVHGSKLADYLVSELALREDFPELFEPAKPPVLSNDKDGE